MEGLKGKQYPTRSGGALSNPSHHSQERVQTGAHSLLTGPLEPTCRPLPKMTILASASLAAASFWPATSFPIKPIRGGASCKTDGLIHICWRPWASGRCQAPWGRCRSVWGQRPTSQCPLPRPAPRPPHPWRPPGEETPLTATCPRGLQWSRLWNHHAPRTLFRKAFSFSHKRNISPLDETWKLSEKRKEDKYWQADSGL